MSSRAPGHALVVVKLLIFLVSLTPALPLAQPCRAQKIWQSSGVTLLPPPFFSPDEFAAIQHCCHQLQQVAQKEVNSLALERRCAALAKDGDISKLMASSTVISRVSRATGLKLHPAEKDFPPECRFYGPGSSMAWHRDCVAYKDPQVEGILTVSVEGGFDGKTQWRLPDGRVLGEVLQPNSLLLLRAGGAEHQVTSATRGKRSIIKLVFATSFERSEEFERLTRATAAATTTVGLSSRKSKRAHGRGRRSS